MLGKRYDLSVAFVPVREMRRQNRLYRGKDRATDILSFPLSKKSGEIIFCLSEVKKEAKQFKRTPENFLLFLLIHGLCHLKGYTHGSTMEYAEAKLRKKFGV